MESTIVTKDSFRDWKANPVTKAMMNDLHQRIFEMHQTLGKSAGIDQLQDRYNVGYLQGLMDIVNTDFEDVSESNND